MLLSCIQVMKGVFGVYMFQGSLHGGYLIFIWVEEKDERWNKEMKEWERNVAKGNKQPN